MSDMTTAQQIPVTTMTTCEAEGVNAVPMWPIMTGDAEAKRYPIEKNAPSPVPRIPAGVVLE
jgi:hypothetical protein